MAERYMWTLMSMKKKMLVSQKPISLRELVSLMPKARKPRKHGPAGKLGGRGSPAADDAPMFGIEPDTRSDDDDGHDQVCFSCVWIDRLLRTPPCLTALSSRYAPRLVSRHAPRPVTRPVSRPVSGRTSRSARLA